MHTRNEVYGPNNKTIHIDKSHPIQGDTQTAIKQDIKKM